ncbi:magnesium and cobalt transport protein CorA [Phenylobacterium soli]|uniref:Magnesium transporter n=1 Tax=Phenylobacterium soli TaxID=2170551 RepID=A0A328AHZ3_9CAUL|nr:magnesium and cobalt transport protein CorA [Phenylobacterium soli]RAK54533.1 magnesium transporter [Phenylobacterium soli]
MTVVAAYVYKDGERVREAQLSEQGLALGPGEFVWIGLCDPDMEELRLLATHFHLHPLAVEDALNAHQLPKVEVYGDELFVVARTAELDGDHIHYGETHVFMGVAYIVTVRHGSARAHTALRAQMEAAPALLRHGPDYVLHAVLDFIVDGYQPIVQEIEEEVLQMEARTLDAFLARADIRRIFMLRRQLVRFRRILAPMEEMASRLEHLELPAIDPEVRPYFRDVADHVRRTSSLVDGLRDVLSQVFEVSNLLEQQRQGVITRKLAAWAAILAVPTAIAGIYGMNFEFMPELHWRLGYAYVLGLIVVLCAVLFWRFRKSDWL